ncbi:DUF3168 domain-containing protein [Maritalea sp.]|uniref:DUF3168 domain-containing protein n=1 Tax=Maritalea sp. TaxID=2003361 RepID=UPI003F4AA96D
MNKAMKDLQTALVSALLADVQLNGLLGNNRIFDAPGKQVKPPYVTVSRHNARWRAAQDTSLSTHMIDWHVWLSEPHRARALEIADRLCDVVLSTAKDGGSYSLIQASHISTQTMIEKRNGWTKVVVQTQFNLDISNI